jgi:hypothetical protein
MHDISSARSGPQVNMELRSTSIRNHPTNTDEEKKETKTKFDRNAQGSFLA